jgi:hypothetical protein
MLVTALNERLGYDAWRKNSEDSTPGQLGKTTP